MGAEDSAAFSSVPAILFAVCSYLLLKKQFRHNMTVYLIGYGIFRFLIEFIRGDDRGKLFGLLSPSQFWSKKQPTRPRLCPIRTQQGSTESAGKPYSVLTSRPLRRRRRV